MIGTSPFQNRRLMVPRWRSFANTLRSKELAAPRGIKRPEEFSSDLLKRLAAWRGEPGLVTAAELVETAIVDGDEPEAVGAANALLNPDSRATPLLKKQAALLLLRAGKNQQLAADQKLPQQETLALWRLRTRLHPHSAIEWVELARCQIILGQKRRAERAMRVALALAPNNRHVLRSASRLYLHLDEFDRAHDLIARNPATKSDPWLLSAEIALSQVAERRPSYYKVGVSVLSETRHLPRQLTELAGAVATTELLDGSRKKAGRYFRQSIIDPNGNALAQAEWASAAFGGMALVSEKNLKAADEAYEAKAFHLHRTASFEEVPSACVQWSFEEPFSIRPYELGAVVANLIGDHDTALELALRGLKIRPNTPSLLNSIAFALANLGKLDEAEANLARVGAGTKEIMGLVTEANRGLIAYRRGQTELGRTLYQKAIDGFRYKQNLYMATSARLWFAREATQSGTADGDEAMAEARRDLEKNRWPDLRRVAEDNDKQRKEKADKAGTLISQRVMTGS